MFDWESVENETLYIIPQKYDIVDEENNIDLLTVESENDNKSYEIKQAIIKNADDIVIHDCIANGKVDSVTLIKKTSAEKPATLYAALYDEDGKLENLKSVNIDGKELSGTELNCNVDLPFGNIDEKHYVKIMLWEGNDSMHPLVDAYDTRIVTTDYLYSNTFLTAGQVDEYSFTVPQDGYYDISVPEGTNINGTLLYGNDGVEIANVNNMSLTNTITYYFRKGEVYKIKFSSSALAMYSFTILRSNIGGNNLSLNTTYTGEIKYKKDRIVYRYIPDDTATYFFEVEGDMCPFVEILDENENLLKYSDNVAYDKSNVLSYELNAGKTYYVRIGTQTGNIGIASLYAKKVKVSINGDTVTITGKADVSSGSKCGMAIYDENGRMIRIAQINTLSSGEFTYTTTLDTSTKAYQCIVNQTSQPKPMYFTFGNGSISKQIATYCEMTSAAGASVSPTFSSNGISANANMMTDITISNRDTANEQKILAFWVLTNQNGEIQKACGTGSEFRPGQNQTLHMEMQMPESVSGLKLQLFVWQGKNIDESSYVPLAKVYTLTQSGLSSLSVNNNENFENAYTDENGGLLAEDYKIEDIDNSKLKATSVLNSDISVNALTEYDYIDMNFQVRCNGRNTGGELQEGKNIITIFYKNKTDNSITFKPVVLWGYYNSDGTFQQTYFQWHEAISLSAKGVADQSDIKEIEYEVEVPYNVDFAAAYWAVDDDYNYVCLNPTALRFNGIYKEQATPIFFEEIGEGKFIYCNNREGIKRTDLADSNNPEPKLLMHEKGLSDGKYEMLLFHNNDTSIGIDSNTGATISYGSGFPIYLDVQFYDPYGTAQMVVNSIGYQIPRGESWACIQGYSDYKQMVITDLAGNNPIYPNTNLGVPYYHDFSSQNAMWIGNRMPRNYYSSVPLSHCVYMVIEFEIINSQGVEVNVAAFKDNGNFDNRFKDYQAGYNPDVTAPFIKDMQYKGVANTLPLVEAKAIMGFDDDLSDNSKLPVTIFNELEPGGNRVDWWKTNINPQAEEYYANHSDSSGMMKFKYNDIRKLNAYGNAYAGEKDTVWLFDTKHSDTYQFPAYRDLENNPNYELPRPYITNSSGASSNRTIAQNLANYGVVYRYNYEIYNHSSYQRTINIMLETTANNVIVIRNPDNPDGLFYAMYKGESDPMANDTIFYASPEGNGNGIGIVVDIVLTTGNAGGMSNSIKIN